MSSIAIIINSCQKFYKTTIDPIIESAKRANIPSQNIYVVVGESDDETPITRNPDYNIVFCKFVNIDYNGIIYFTQTTNGSNELKKYTHFFYIHDTCKFMPSFWRKIRDYARTCETYIKLESIGSKNIGLINVEWFLNNKKELFSYYINYDKSLAMLYKDGDFPNKDFIYKRFNNLAKWLNEDCLFIFDNFNPIGQVFNNPMKKSYIEKTYSKEDRKATEYLEPGIIKYQKNWGQAPWNLDL